jgi:DNA polymerase epsilon subunit 2
MGFPPAEERNDSLNAMSITDIYGAGWRPQHLLQLQELESNALDTMFIILSDVQLDRPIVMDKLLEVFQGFEGTEGNIVFILIGNFITKSITVPGGRDHARNTFKTLSEVISSCPRLANQAKFVLVPGPIDPGLSSALPRRPLPEILVKDLMKNIPNVSFASNPCRIRFFTQEIVIYR